MISGIHVYASAQQYFCCPIDQLLLLFKVARHTNISFDGSIKNIL